MFQDTRFRFLLTLLLLYLGVNLLVRISFIILFSPDISTDYGIIAKIFLYGTVNDFFVFACLSLPLAPMVLLFSWRNRIARAGAFAAFAAYTALFLFTAVSEYFFWDEFSVRFNFIAVDYLVYTQEVINNIMESYPVTPLLCAITGLALLITTALLRPLQRARGTMTSDAAVSPHAACGESSHASAFLPSLHLPFPGTRLTTNCPITEYVLFFMPFSTTS